MAAYKLSMRFPRDDYNLPRAARAEEDEEIKATIMDLLGKKKIQIARMYAPSRNSVKVIFDNEVELNKVLQHKQLFLDKNITPSISMAFKASRSIFCSGFDDALLTTYDQEAIRDELVSKGWKVMGVYVMRSKKSFKIEFCSKKDAQKFLSNTKTNIGGIRILNFNKEVETDPTINQCWGCGRIEPNHSSQTCYEARSHNPLCLKCGARGHKFYDCSIPKDLTDMTQRQKEKRFCIPCDQRGTHTSLDHSQCPTKREIIQKRIRAARAERTNQNKSEERDLNLIKSVIDFQQDAWPELSQARHIKISTIISLALMDEASNKGVFQNKLTEGCKNNGIPEIKYNLEPNTATHFFNTLAGYHASTDQSNASNAVTTNTHTTHTEHNYSQGASNTIQGASSSTSTPIFPPQQGTKPTFSKHYRDSTGGKRPGQFSNDMDTGTWDTESESPKIKEVKRNRQEGERTNTQQNISLDASMDKAENPNTSGKEATSTHTPFHTPTKINNSGQKLNVSNDAMNDSLYENDPNSEIVMNKIKKLRQNLQSCRLNILSTLISKQIFHNKEYAHSAQININTLNNILTDLTIFNNPIWVSALGAEVTQLMDEGFAKVKLICKVQLHNSKETAKQDFQCN